MGGGVTGGSTQGLKVDPRVLTFFFSCPLTWTSVIGRGSQHPWNGEGIVVQGFKSINLATLSLGSNPSPATY